MLWCHPRHQVAPEGTAEAGQTETQQRHGAELTELERLENHGIHSTKVQRNFRFQRAYGGIIAEWKYRR